MKKVNKEETSKKNTDEEGRGKQGKRCVSGRLAKWMNEGEREEDKVGNRR